MCCPVAYFGRFSLFARSLPSHETWEWGRRFLFDFWLELMELSVLSDWSESQKASKKCDKMHFFIRCSAIHWHLCLCSSVIWLAKLLLHTIKSAQWLTASFSKFHWSGRLLSHSSLCSFGSKQNSPQTMQPLILTFIMKQALISFFVTILKIINFAKTNSFLLWNVFSFSCFSLL